MWAKSVHPTPVIAHNGFVFMNKTKDSIISLLIFKAAFFGYSAFIIYKMVEMKKLGISLFSLMRLNSHIGLVSIGIALAIQKGVLNFYFKKNLSKESWESKPVWILEKFTCLFTGFSLASIFWLIPFMGLKNR